VKQMRQLVTALVLGVASWASAQVTTPNTDVLGAHDMSSGANSVRGPNSNACAYCHVPHRSVSNTPLWNQTLSTQPYTFYTSGTSQNTSTQPAVGKTSSLCLSCHDGTVAVGQTVGIGTLKMTGTMNTVFGSRLEGSHPFSLQLPIKDAANLVPSLVASHTTKDPTVRLIDGNIECNTCHDVHYQNIDKRSPNFLVRDNAGGQVCLACHEVNARTVDGRENSLVRWLTSTHAKSPAQVALKAGLGGYSMVSEFACSSCHTTHNATGPGLLRKSVNRPANVDDTAQTCFACHDGSDNLSQPILNVLADFQKSGAHPFSDTGNPHALGEPVVLDRNRHATCADCHNSHGTSATTTFTGTSDLRPSQTGVSGVSVSGSVLNTAANQYENCLRCHGTSTNKQSLSRYGVMPARGLFQGDTLNVILEFGTSATSTHPVMRDAMSQAQPSLLKFMWDITGKIQSRSMGARILCTDCHNSDTNREFGGNGPNGPHGSKFSHILEREYIISQVAPGTWPAGGPGTNLVNLNPNPPLDPASGGPYSLCAKCHDLNSVVSNASFTAHGSHITTGISCSVCHSGHGVPAGTAGLSGRRLINFDLNVVAPNAGVISYANNTCTLRCHMVDHNPDGSVSAVQP
jgi:predicted CXXCH cytochrome family protein